MSGIVNAFTVDLEEWFQGLTSTNRQVDRWPAFESRVVPATKQLLALLAEFDVRATFFVLGHVADRQPALIERVAAAGHELAVHGYHHRFVHELTPDQFRRELDLSLAALEQITGERPIGHRAPYFSINAATPWAFDVLAEFGFRYDSSVFPVRSLLYGFPHAPRFPYRLPNGLVEFPASTLRLGGVNWPIAGGFYNRALPGAFNHWAVRRLNRAGQPAILYMHPWELDLAQNYRQVTARERLTHYYGRRWLAGRLRRLLADFRFGPLRDRLLDLRDRDGAVTAVPPRNQPTPIHP